MVLDCVFVGVCLVWYGFGGFGCFRRGFASWFALMVLFMWFWDFCLATLVGLGFGNCCCVCCSFFVVGLLLPIASCFAVSAGGCFSCGFGGFEGGLVWRFAWRVCVLDVGFCVWTFLRDVLVLCYLGLLNCVGVSCFLLWVVGFGVDDVLVGCAVLGFVGV